MSYEVKWHSNKKKKKDKRIKIYFHAPGILKSEHFTTLLVQITADYIKYSDCH